MSQWTKPSGMKIELNDEPATLAHAKELGWKRTRGKADPKPEKPKDE